MTSARDIFDQSTKTEGLARGKGAMKYEMGVIAVSLLVVLCLLTPGASGGATAATTQFSTASSIVRDLHLRGAGVTLFKCMHLKGGAAEEDDEDLFGDDNEEDEAAKEEMRNRAAEARAASKGDKPPAKTNIVLDIKGWSDETDLVKLEELVRKIEMDGLLWGAAGLEEVGYGIKKLRITCVVEDDKVSVDDLEEKIMELEELVQSVDVAAMQKI